jgi:hypothetical protein
MEKNLKTPHFHPGINGLVRVAMPSVATSAGFKVTGSWLSGQPGVILPLLRDEELNMEEVALLTLMLEDAFYHPERYCPILDCVSYACADVWVCVWGCGRAFVCASAGLALCRNALTPAGSTL